MPVQGVKNLFRRNLGSQLGIVLSVKLNLDKMKYFKCGNCQAPYKIDEATIKKVQVAVNCPKCGVKYHSIWSLFTCSNQG
ncbi:MAG: MJ0042-type zinc finger domain-containing protein [Bacteroidota bacterium]